MKNILIFLFAIPILGFNANDNPKLSSDIFTIEYNNLMHSKIMSKLPSSEVLMNSFFPSEQLILDHQTISDFNLTGTKELMTEDSKGLLIEGTYTDGNINIKKELKIEIKNHFPDFLVTKVKYTNSGSDTLTIVGWINNSYNIK